VNKRESGLADKGTEPRPRRRRGEQTRLEILEATLAVIAAQGYRAVTHRSVAAAAGVNFSLVSYYFRTLDDLLLAAFSHVLARGRDELEATWQAVFTCLDPALRGDMRRRDTREAICRRLSGIASDYVLRQARQYPEGLVMEMIACFDLNVDVALRELARRYRDAQLERFCQMCELMGSLQPRLDAQLCLGTLQRLQYEAVAGLYPMDPELVSTQLARQFAWILRLPDR
jgi:DNA-binding transcriptional regulator YbjK